MKHGQLLFVHYDGQFEVSLKWQAAIPNPVTSRDSGPPGPPARLILQDTSTPFELPQQQGIINTCNIHR